MNKSRLIIKIYVLTLITVLSAKSLAKEKIVAQSWHQILLNTKHIGYAVYQTKTNKSKMINTQFFRIFINGQTITSSSKTVSLNNKVGSLLPQSYEYTYMAGNSTKQIKGIVEGNVLKTVVTENNQAKEFKKPIKPGAFFATSLGYALLMNKRGGLQVSDTPITYDAIAEEDGAVYRGSAKIIKTMQVGGQDTFEVKNTFKNETVYYYLSPQAHVVRSENKNQSLDTQMVTTSTEAAKSYSIPDASLKLLFGNVPGPTLLPGTKEPQIKKKTSKKLPKKKNIKEPKQSVPPGKGLSIPVKTIEPKESN